jgi:hypothetical protein
MLFPSGKKIPLLKVQEEAYVYTILSSSRYEWTCHSYLPKLAPELLVWLPRLRRVGPSASLDKSEYLISRGYITVNSDLSSGNLFFVAG